MMKGGHGPTKLLSDMYLTMHLMHPNYCWITIISYIGGGTNHTITCVSMRLCEQNVIEGHLTAILFLYICNYLNLSLL